MKNRIAVLAALFVLTSSAFATNYPPPPPPPQPAGPTTTTTTNKNTNGAVAGSVAGAGASVDGVSADSGDSNSDADSASRSGSSITNGSSRAWSLFLPPPVFTPPMPRPDTPLGCPAPTETQDSVAVLAGVAFSKASSLRDNDPCTAIKFSQLLWDRCQYAKAAKILDVGMKKFAAKADVEWDMVQDTTLTDYKASECVVLRNPPPVTNNYVTNYVAEAPKPAPPAPAVTPCPKGQKRNSKGVCYKPTPPCEEGKILACTKK